MKTKIDYVEQSMNTQNMEEVYKKYGLTKDEAMDIFGKMTDEQQRAVRVLCTYECNKMMESMKTMLTDIRKGTVLEKKESQRDHFLG